MYMCVECVEEFMQQNMNTQTGTSQVRQLTLEIIQVIIFY